MLARVGTQLRAEAIVSPEKDGGCRQIADKYGQLKLIQLYTLRDFFRSVVISHGGRPFPESSVVGPG